MECYDGEGTATETHTKKVNDLILQLNKSRQRRICAVFDFDMFYVAVELADKPWLASRPVVVKGDCIDRPIVTSANYVARQYGIRAGMPVWQAQKCVKNLVVLKQRKDQQQKISETAMDILRAYDANMISPSLDEAKVELGPYLMITYGEMTYEHAEGVVSNIRAAILQTTKLTISAGISCNFLMAKMASDFKSPMGNIRSVRKPSTPFFHRFPFANFMALDRS